MPLRMLGGSLEHYAASASGIILLMIDPNELEEQMLKPADVAQADGRWQASRRMML